MTPPQRPLRLVFMGTPDFALPTLAALRRAGHEIACVYCQPPRPAGRGQKPRPSPVQAEADRAGLPVRTPARLKDANVQAAFDALDADAAVIVAYGLILPLPVLTAPRLGCLNLHASLLPRWRGAAPIQRAIMDGDSETGVTIMQMEEGLDTGPVLLTERVPISAETTAADLHDALAARGADLMVAALTGLDAGRLTPKPQPDSGITYAAKIDKAETRIDWRLPAEVLDRRVRALSPSPGAWFQRDGGRVKVLRAHPVSDGGGTPGTVLADGATVACGAGALRLAQVQPAGKGAMTAAAYLRGNALTPGMVLASPEAED